MTMAPKAPSEKAIEKGLADAVRRIWNSAEKADLSVNLVRQRVEEELELGDGFFKGDKWKAKSKQVIKETVDELDNAAPESSQISAAPSPKPTAKSVSKPQKKKTAPPKANKPSATASKAKRKRATKKSVSESELESDEDEEEEDSAEDTPSDADSEEEPPKKKTKPAPKPKAKPDKAAVKAKPQKAAPKKQEESADSSLSDIDSDEVKDTAPSKTKSTNDDAEASSSEESIVIDEPPKRKRQSKDASSAGAAKPKSKAKAPAELSPDEAEIKKLQGQLLKCGVRKIWAFELKEYGDNAKAKIRHLRNLLKELGMDGRFSEAKAREVKERRELEADLEAVKEMDENWGAGGGRVSRSRAARKSLKEPSDDEAEPADGTAKETQDDGGDSETGDKANARAKGSARYRADFAFLNDDDESDSD